MSTDLLELGINESEAQEVSDVHRMHADLVWRSLQRLGVRSSDLEDLSQEVFVVVHRRLSSLSRPEALRSWLFGICVRVAKAHRRRAHVRREIASDCVPEQSTNVTPEESLVHMQAQARLVAILDEMDLEKRAVFVMYEVDELSCEEIAEIIDAPLGTVHSRLYAARAEFAKVLARHQARAANRRFV